MGSDLLRSFGVEDGVVLGLHGDVARRALRPGRLCGDLGLLGVDREQIGDLGDGGLTAVAAELLGCIGVGSGRMAPKMWTNS